MTTPEKFDAVTRRAQNGMSFLSDVALFCVDEVHILNDERGPALEAVVSRLKLLSRLPSLAGTPLSGEQRELVTLLEAARRTWS